MIKNLIKKYMIYSPPEIGVNEVDSILKGNPYVMYKTKGTADYFYTHYRRHEIKNGLIEESRSADIISFSSINDIKKSKYLISNNFEDSRYFQSDFQFGDTKDYNNSIVSFFKNSQSHYIYVSLLSYINYCKENNLIKNLDMLDIDELRNHKFDIYAHLKKK
jgi:hypothetical protein